MGARHYYAIEIESSTGDIDLHSFESRSTREYWLMSGTYDKQNYSRKAISTKDCDDLLRRNRESAFIRHNQELTKKGKRRMFAIVDKKTKSFEYGYVATREEAEKMIPMLEAENKEDEDYQPDFHAIIEVE